MGARILRGTANNPWPGEMIELNLIGGNFLSRQFPLL